MLLLLGVLLAQSSGLPTALAQDPPPVVAPQEEDSKSEFSINVNLWPILESTTLPTGERRTSLWPLFHVTTLPKGGVHSWHVLNFLTGPNYHMFLPLYYSVDENLGIFPPLYLSGSDYWASAPLLSGSWWRHDGSRTTWVTPLFHLSTDPAGDPRNFHVGPYFQGDDYWMVPPALTGGWTHADGAQSTWVTPLFHVTTAPTGDLKSLHVGPYFQGDDYWMIPPALTGSWTHSDGAQSTWVTPLFHATRDKDGSLDNLHVGPYFQGKNFWAIPPAFTWQRTYDSGETATWVTPLFHSTVDRDGDFVSMHLGPYFRGKDYWTLFPLASSTSDEDGSTSTWITPLFHLKTDAKGELETLLAGPYLGRKTWWSVWPLLLAGWEDGNDYRLTMGGVFCVKSDAAGLASASLCPIFMWDRESWCVFPLLSGGNKDVTWITPAAHFSFDHEGAVDDFHVGPYFQGKNYWMVPPALSWQWKYEDNVEALWLTPLFHTTWDPEGNAESSHLFPIYFWDHDDYWGVPPLLSGSWRYPDGARTTWLTPLFHVTSSGDAIDSLHVGPYFQGRNYWAVPPLLSWHVRHPDGANSTWLTPAFHVTTDATGDLKSFHLLPLFAWERDEYWLAPALLSGGGRLGDGGHTTWITPLFHDTIDRNGDLRSLHVAPLWFWERDRFWAVPPLLTGGGIHEDGARTTWLTPMFHYTSDRVGLSESAHLFPAFFWKRDDYWLAPLLLSGGSTRPDGSTSRWLTPLYHDDCNADGTLRSRMALTYFEGPAYTHVVPVFWDWTRRNGVHHTLFAPPLFVRTEEPDGNVTTSLPWPLITARSGPALDRSLGMELRPFLYQDAGDQYEFNFLWRLFSVLSDEEATRVMVGPLWYSTRPNQPDAMSKFQILGGLFARDCNYETERYRYRLLWFIPLGTKPMREQETN